MPDSRVFPASFSSPASAFLPTAAPPLDEAKEKAPAAARRLDVLILGGGFSGVAAAQELARKAADLKVGLLADQNVMLFHPMLAEVCGASLSPRHIVNPIRHLCPRAELFLANVTGIDFAAKRVTAQSGLELHESAFDYDHLVIALGGVVDLSRVPGMAEHGLPIKTVGDAFRIRTRVIDRLEQANLAESAEERSSLLGFAVVGGGYSGVETAGQIADLLHAARKWFPWLEETPPRIFLIHSGPALLPQIDEKLGKFAQRKLEERGVKVVLNTRVSAVTATTVRLPSGSIDVRTIVTTVGNTAHPLLVELEKRGELPMDRGRIVTGPTLEIPTHRRVWAAGDCAWVRLPDAKDAPATAQFAQREGRLVGVNIARLAQAKTPRPFTFTGLGELASIGHHNAVAKIGGFTFSGFVAWWMWRTIYLSKLPGLERKLRVVMDWTLDVIFPRDLSLMRTETTPRLPVAHFEAGDVLYERGDPALRFYILQRGLVEIRDEQGALKTIHPGEHFGERELLTGQPRLFCAVAAEPSELLMLPREMFGALSLASPGFMTRLQSSSLQYASRAEMNAWLEKIPAEIRRQRVSQRMKREVVSLKDTATVGEALETYKAHAYTHLPVTDQEGRIRGVILKDHLLDLLQQTGADQGAKIPDGAVLPAMILRADDAIEPVVRRMLRSGQRLWCVGDEEDRLVGVLSLVDAAID